MELAEPAGALSKTSRADLVDQLYEAGIGGQMSDRLAWAIAAGGDV